VKAQPLDDAVWQERVSEGALRAALRTLEAQAAETVAALRDLIRIPSVTGDEARAQARVAGLFEQASLDVEVYCPTREELEGHPSFSDDGLPLGERPVAVGTAGPQDPVVVLNGHVDVVPVGDLAGWPYPPWDAEVHDGAVWGRGSCDMKGGLVAGWAALRAIADAGVDLPVGVSFASVIGEETGGVGTLSAVLRGHGGETAIVLEPTRCDICPVGAGALSFEIAVDGKAAHGALRTHGVSAVDEFLPVLEALRTLEVVRNGRFSHPLFAAEGTLAAPLSVGTVEAGNWPSTVPERLVARGRYGVLPGESPEAARDEFERAVAAAAAGDAWLATHPPSVRWIEGQFAPAGTPTDAAVVQRIAAAHTLLTGSTVGMHGVPYGSDLRFYVNDAQMPAVLFGPGDVRLAHTVDEHVPIREVLHVARVLTATLLGWHA
jgi:acetylornithine deacetylase